MASAILQVKGLRQFLLPNSSAPGSTARPPSPTATPAPNPSNSASNTPPASTSSSAARSAADVLEILRLYAASCIPIPRTTERFYWSVSCLPSTYDKPLARVNASWMELFTLLPDGRPCAPASSSTCPTSPPTARPNRTISTCPPGKLRRAAQDVSHFRGKPTPSALKVHTAASIRAFLTHPHARRAIRRFNLTHMNRGRNAYQASHCYSLADHMVGDA